MTQPLDADATFLIYLNSVPLVAFSLGAIHDFLLWSNSSAVSLTDISRLSMDKIELNMGFQIKVDTED